MIKKIIKRIDERILNKFIYRCLVRIGFLKKSYPSNDEKYGNQFDDFIFDSSVKNQLECVDPKTIVTSGRLDIVVRYLFFKELEYGTVSKDIESLYCRTILTRTGAVEPLEYYSSTEKIGINKHIDSARLLLESMKKDGFQPEYYVPIADDYGLYNGAHRVAAGMALNQNIWVKFEGEHGVKDLNFEWFVDNGFNLDDQIRILRGFSDIHKNCSIFILYGTCENDWVFIQKKIEKALNIVGHIDLDFSKNYLAFENLIHDIYMDYNELSVIERKIELLKFASLIVRVIVVSDEKVQTNHFYKDLINIKTEIRDCLDAKYPKDAFITIHGSDNRAEFFHMKNVLLSVNNLRCLNMRSKIPRREDFLKWINEFKCYCNKHGIDVNDTCIIGSSPLEVMGIRNSTDIDIMVSPELRSVFGDGIVHLTDNLDIGTRNYVKNEQTGDIYLYDEQLIYDDNCHFIFDGCKFANIELIHKRKSSSNRDKDIKDVRLMDLFFDCCKYFDDKKILQLQIEKELARRKSLNI